MRTRRNVRRRFSPHYNLFAASMRALLAAFVLLALRRCAVLGVGPVHTSANFCLGLDVDGSAQEWESCASPEITMDMTQVGFPGSEVRTDSMKVRIAHDGTNIFVLAKITAPYYFTLEGGNGLAHASSVMWKIGSDATMQNMGGCEIPGVANPQYNCTLVKEVCAADGGCDCSAHLVDVWHMESASPGAIPGVQYPWRAPLVFPRNQSLGYDLDRYQPSVGRLFDGNDHTSNTDDEFSVHPCLRGDDGATLPHLSSFTLPNQTYRNHIRFAWSHSAIKSRMYPFGERGEEGTYVYEYSRPLLTGENTDVQFAVGTKAYFSFALWIPSALGEEEWEDGNHFVSPSSLEFASVMLEPGPFSRESSAASSAGTGALSLLLVGLLLATF